MTGTDIETFDLATGRALVSRARHAVEQAARSDGEPTLSLDPPTGELRAVRGAFVTLERGERLRGCIGRPNPDQALGEVVVEAAIDAAVNDPRCSPVQPGEADELTVTVTVLSEPQPLPAGEPTASPEYVETGRHGLVVEGNRHRGLLLPQVALDRGWDAEAFLTATCQKAGLPGRIWRTGDVEIKRFTARAFTEEEPRGDVVERPLDQPADDGNEEAGQEGGDTGPDGEALADGGTVREPAVAGEFYAGDAEGLREQLRTCFTHAEGPGSLPDGTGDDADLLAVVAPHAGYPYSGPIAAHSYAALARAERPETVVVLGPNHRRVGDPVAVAPHDRWRTPLGDVPVDRALAEAVVELDEDATFDPVAHEGEHSIEVQLPFLQRVLEDVSVLPVCIGGIGRERAERLGQAIADAIERTSRDAIVVSSTDLTHYQPHEAAVAADEPVREAIESLDTTAIERLVDRQAHSMCGPWATVAGLAAAGARGGQAGEVLKYATSADTAGSPGRVVGYCAAAVRT